MGKVWIAKLVKGGNTISIKVSANSQGEARKIAENMCKTIYFGYKVGGNPQLKKS